MDAHGEHDDLTEEGDQGAYQERATAMLDLIAQRTKLALSEAASTSSYSFSFHKTATPF
jgi:hypothetical protein